VEHLNDIKNELIGYEMTSLGISVCELFW